MLKVLLLFVLLIAGIVVGPMIAGHQGYVLIQGVIHDKKCEKTKTC